MSERLKLYQKFPGYLHSLLDPRSMSEAGVSFLTLSFCVFWASFLFAPLESLPVALQCSAIAADFGETDLLGIGPPSLNDI